MFLPLAAVLSFASLGCSESDPDPQLFTAVSYNAGLAVGFVSAANQRAPLTTSQIVAIDADLLCVQEYWNSEHVDQLTAAAGSSYQGLEFLDPDPGVSDQAACAPGDVDEIFSCTETNCADLCLDDLTGCVLGKCGGPLAKLMTDSSSCYSCLVANVGKDIGIIKTICESQSTEYAYGGSFGIGLLTKTAPLATSSKVFDSAINRRAVIHSRLQSDSGQSLDVFCTHLTAVFSDIPHPTDTDKDAWTNEQAKQIDELLSFIVQTAGGTDGVVLLGDFNTGPKGSKYLAEVPDNYQKLVDAGLSNPYTANADASCTFCSDNPINKSGNDHDNSVVIDHVLLGGISDVREAKRVIDGTVQVESCGKKAETAYSDHYGVSVTFGR
jgi:endonuclease/exonuclease/phosphatase family metal-dependent hydrolase